MPVTPMAQFIWRYYNDPVAFVRNVLGQEPDPWQAELLEAVAAGERKITVRSGHGVGKSTGLSWLGIWHFLTRFPQKTVITAPTSAQLFDALFAEMKFWLNALPDFLKELYEATSERVVLKAQPEASFISARTSSKEKPEALQGIHSEHVLLLVDEAPGVDEAVFEAAVGSMSGHSATTVLLGNPSRSTGMFHASHHTLTGWRRFHVSGENHPRVSQAFVDQVKDTYGENSNAYRVRVLGEFPLADDDTLIPAELVDAAMVRDVAEDPLASLVYGVDPARFGDDSSVLCKRRGDWVYPLLSWRGLDTMQLVGAIVNEIEQDNPEEICVDSIGLGAGVADRLRELGYNVRDVNVSEASAINTKASRLRDDLWMQVRDFLSQRACRLPRDEVLRGDLVAPTYKFASNGKLVVEPKADMKKRLKRSPDRADALAATFAGIASRVGGRVSSWSPGKPLRRRVQTN